MKTSYTKLFLLISIIGLVSFNACKKADNINLAMEEEVQLYDTISFATDHILETKKIESFEGDIIYNDLSTMFDPNDPYAPRGLNAVARINDGLIESSYIFLTGKDSVIVNGIITVLEYYSPVMDRVIYNFLQANKVKLRYKVEDNEIKVFVGDFKQIDLNGVEWATIGYGEKDNFSTFINYKYVHLPLTYAETAVSVDPTFTLPTDNNNWSQLFFRKLPEWTIKDGSAYSLTINKMPHLSAITEEVKRYDFKRK